MRSLPDCLEPAPVLLVALHQLDEIERAVRRHPSGHTRPRT